MGDLCTAAQPCQSRQKETNGRERSVDERVRVSVNEKADLSLSSKSNDRLLVPMLLIQKIWCVDNSHALECAAGARTWSGAQRGVRTRTSTELSKAVRAARTQVERKGQGRKRRSASALQRRAQTWSCDGPQNAASRSSMKLGRRQFSLYLKRFFEKSSR